MQLVEVFSKSTVPAMSDAERHGWLEFLNDWLSGHYMTRRPNRDALPRWQQFAKLFPPRVPSQLRLMRLVTVPIGYAKQRQFRFKPAPGPVSSWTRTLVGLDAVAGIANESNDNARTARLGIEAIIPGNLVLATHQSIRDAFLAMSHDYFERYPEIVKRTKQKDGKFLISYSHPGYPGGDDAAFSMDDVGFLRDVLTRPGGHYRQYEVIVKTPPLVDATVVQIYRVGTQTRRIGNDDPHQYEQGMRPPRVTRLKY